MIPAPAPLPAAGGAAVAPFDDGSSPSGTDTVIGCTSTDAPTSVASVVVPEDALSRSAAPTPRVTAQVYTFDDGGTEFTERIPPSDWSPATATDAELQFFGYPARPADASALSTWTQNWAAGYKATGVVYPCSGEDESSGLVRSAELDSYNWSGAVAEGGGFTEAYGMTTFNNGVGCSAQPDSYANWVGIGGKASVGKLLQNGFWSDHLGGKSFPFWEAINPNHDTGTQPVSLSGIAFGDVFTISTTYDPDTVTAHFGWHDVTSGVQYQLVTKTSIDGYSTARYWDGSQAEVVDERGKIVDQITTLRNFGSDPWTRAQVSVDSGNLVPLRSISPHDGFFMVSNGVKISTPTSGTTTDAVTDNWHGCGVVNG